jgi:AcrR family transcriptional regulator
MRAMGRLPADKRKEQLLDVAAELFARDGYARATTAQLAKAAGVTEPIIYRHFESKRDLFVALIERTAADTLEHWENRLATAKDPVERLARLTEENPFTTPGGRVPYRVFLQAITEVNDPVIHKAVVSHVRDLHSFLSREISQAQDEKKLIKVFSAELLAWTLIHIGLGYGFLDAINVPNQGSDAAGNHVQPMLARLLTRRHD